MYTTLTGLKAYIIAPKGLEVGQRIVSGPDADIKVGNALPLANIPVGTVIHNIELQPGKGAELIRAAGASAQVLGQEGKYVLVRLQSGEVRMVLGTCRATIGTVGNEQQSLINLGKAGRNRWKGIRPTVRGSVMNPNDHPHGGGEGKAPVDVKRHLLHGVNLRLVLKLVTRKRNLTNLSFVVATKNNHKQLAYTFRQLGSAA